MSNNNGGKRIISTMSTRELVRQTTPSEVIKKSASVGTLVRVRNDRVGDSNQKPNSGNSGSTSQSSQGGQGQG